MTNKEKENLKEILAKGQTDIAISKITEIAKKEILEDIYNEILVISSNYESAKNQFILNLSKNDEWNIQLAKINSGILYIVDKMPIDDKQIHGKASKGKRLKRETDSSKLKNDIDSVNSLFIQAIEIVKKELKNENNYGYANKVLDTLIKLYARCQNQTFQIAVMALVKSGKSTFLNALLGNEYLPMANVPETAIPVRIHHKETDEKDRHSHGELRNSRLNAVLANGVNKILEQLKVLNKRERDDELTGMEYNLILEAPLKILEKKDLGDIKFEILDTPGFGEAELESLRGTNHSINKSINEIIEEIGVIIYLLDYTKLRTQEEAEVMEKLSVLREDLLDKVQERLFFIVNKIDLRDRNGLSPKETITYVHQLVSPKVPKIKEEQIFTLSSYDALLSRLILDNIASDKAKLDFTNTAFGRSKKEATDEELKNIAPVILAESNILLIEENIINYIYNNRMKLLVQDLLTGLERQMLEYKNKVIETAIGTLNLDRLKIAELETKIEEAKKKVGRN